MYSVKVCLQQTWTDRLFPACSFTSEGPQHHSTVQGGGPDQWCWRCLGSRVISMSDFLTATTQNLFKRIINHHLNASNIPILNYLSSIACKKGNSYNGSFQTLHCKWLTTRQVIVIFTSTQNNTKVFEHFKSFIFQKQCSHLSLVIRCKHLAIMALKIQSLTELPQF